MTEHKRTESRNKRTFDNPAKTASRYNKVGIQPTKRPNGSKKSKNQMSKNVGLFLFGIQGIASIAFMVTLLILNMLPVMYLAIIGVLLLLLLGITLATQLTAKKKGIGGKVFSVIMSLILIMGTFYSGKFNQAVGKISAGDYKVDNMVVAVLSNDPAETIQDAQGYNFGVQYAMGGEDVKTAIAHINEKTGAQVAVSEFPGLSEQAQALHDGQVQAIVYNEGYTGILEEAFEGYSGNVKIIYSHEIKKAVDNTAAKVEVKNEAFNIFISGIDVYGPIATNSRSDVNIVATVNPSTHQVLLATTPRDYYVEIPGVTNGQKDKLTHAGIYGVDASIQTLNALYDTNIDFYARVNFTSLIEMIDVLGGVDVNSEFAFTTSEDSGLVMDVQQGMNSFNGKEALAFSRERQNVPGGDNQRGKDQQAVITAMIKKMISPTMLLNANGIIDSVSGNVETNMSPDQIQSLIKTQLSKGGAWNIKSMAAEGEGDSQYCFSYTGKPLYVTQPNQASVDAIKTAIKQVENGETLPESEVAE
ncbi:MAG: LCP family protein [Lachnospiraceae bacterium]